MGQAITYGAAVDIRDVPDLPGKVIDADDPGSDDVYVECVVGARLVPVGDIDVEPSDTADGGWRYLEFTRSGVLEWSWTVTPRAPDSQQLRLELRPAAKSADLIKQGSTTTADYITTVNVSATRIDRLAYWFRTQWVLLAAVAASAGVAILAILTFSAEARKKFTDLFQKPSPNNRTHTGSSAAATSTKRSQSKKQPNKEG